MSLIEKIDAEIAKGTQKWESDIVIGLQIAKEIILSEQKDLSKTLTDIYNEYPYKVVGRTDTYSKYNEAWTDAVNRVADVLGVDF